MKILRYAVMAVLFLGLSRVARAYQVLVLDPTNGDSPLFVIHPGAAFSFGFANCNVTLGDVTYKGCAVGFNDSNQTLTSFDLSYANDPVLNNDAANCASNAFSDIHCGLPQGGEYELSFEDACGSSTCGILPYHFVLLFENAVDGSAFPDVDGIANSTPEPASIWLLLSGLGSAGYLVRRRRNISIV